MSDKQRLGSGATKDRLDTVLEWNAAFERQCGKPMPTEEPGSGKARMPEGAGAGSEIGDIDDEPGGRGC